MALSKVYLVLAITICTVAARDLYLSKRDEIVDAGMQAAKIATAASGVPGGLMKRCKIPKGRSCGRLHGSSSCSCSNESHSNEDSCSLEGHKGRGGSGSATYQKDTEIDITTSARRTGSSGSHGNRGSCGNSGNSGYSGSGFKGKGASGSVTYESEAEIDISTGGQYESGSSSYGSGLGGSKKCGKSMGKGSSGSVTYESEAEIDISTSGQRSLGSQKGSCSSSSGKGFGSGSGSQQIKKTAQYSESKQYGQEKGVQMGKKCGCK